MAIENCGCGGSNLDRFYSLFTCDHVCSTCKWYNPKCCNSCYDTGNNKSTNHKCLNYYDINMVDVIHSRIKQFGYCDNHKALGIQFTDGTKKLILNVERDVYEGLLDLNKDLLYMYLLENTSSDKNQCITIN